MAMIVVGIDEVGRGCWAGPVVAGAVVLKGSLDGLTDSKLLTRRQREAMAPRIYDNAAAIGLGWVDAKYIDEYGLTAAIRLAMTRALAEISCSFDRIIIDGSYNFLAPDKRAVAQVRADYEVPAVSAASIVAKVARDQFMREVSKEYPDYGFDRHVGYGTKLHHERLVRHGVCVLHRRSFRPVSVILQ